MKQETNYEEFDTAKVFRKLIEQNVPQTGLARTQQYFATIERKSNFLRELGALCMKYGVGSIYELEYHEESDSSYVTINCAHGPYRLYVRKNYDITEIVRCIFAAMTEKN